MRKLRLWKIKRHPQITQQISTEQKLEIWSPEDSSSAVSTTPCLQNEKEGGVEKTEVPIDAWMDKDNVVHIHDGVLFSHEKEGQPTICNNMDGPSAHDANVR